jgi:hypothetical protein
MCSPVSAQKLITIESVNGVFQYETIDSALAHASDGDQVFVPGGIFNVGNLHVNSSVMIYGAGHFNDSTMATGQTFIVGNIVLGNGASAGIITGFNIDGDIKVDSSGRDSVSNYTVSRCSFKNLFLSANGAPPTNARNFSIYENVIRGGVFAANAPGLNISKNFIEGALGNMVGSVILNNDFLGLGDCTDLKNMLVSVKTSNFDNNIFFYSPPACAGAAFFDTGSVNNVFMNCLFVMNLNFPVSGNTGFGNYNNQPVSSIFVNSSGGVFSYNDNYSLKPGSPAVYGGSDNFDVGVSGTSVPFKIASVPFNPHIQQKSVGQMTNPQGLINVHIKVSAQDH